MEVHALEVRVESPDADGFRPVLVAVDVEGSESALSDAHLSLVLLGRDGGLLRELAPLALGVIQPGRQFKVLRTRTRLVAPPAQARWSIEASSVVWRGPVRALADSAEATPALDAAVPPQAFPDAPTVSRETPSRTRNWSSPAPARTWSAPAPAPLPRAETPPPPPTPPPATRWTRVEAGDAAVVDEEFVGTSLDMDGRDRVREMLRSDDPVQLTLGCRICAVTGWRTAAQNMRRLLQHEEIAVRVAAAEAIGVLAGPAMEHYLKPLVQDPHKEVRKAALTAISRLAQT